MGGKAKPNLSCEKKQKNERDCRNTPPGGTDDVPKKAKKKLSSQKNVKEESHTY